jgi:DNA polymerase epsilon subunit 2
MLLGQLIILPTGELAICDLTGSIALDLKRAVAIPEDSAWFCPGMIVLVDGVYEEEDESTGKGLSGNSGVGGVLGGRFQGFFIGQPPCEKRRDTLGISGPDGNQDHTIGGGFGWIDFLGVGSERAAGAKMRRLEQRLLRSPSQDEPFRDRVVILGELNLDQPRAIQAFRKILSIYASEPEGSAPLTFVVTGNFTQHAVMARGGSGGSIEYKEYFDAMAAAMSEYPTLLQSSTFVFVPGDNDGWVSAFTAGASVPLPRKPVPDMFTSRIRRAFATANAENSSSSSKVSGSAVWTSNPSRLTLFGPNHELVLFRDDISARLRRTSVNLQSITMPSSENDPDGPPETEGLTAATEEAADQEEEIESQAMELDAAAPSKPSPTSASRSRSPAQDMHAAQKLVKTVLDQGYLAPFRQSIRPVHWDYTTALHLYPLPTALVLVDTTSPPFCVTYEGCHVMNPGSLLVPGKKGVGRWVEYRVGKTGVLRECAF